MYALRADRGNITHMGEENKIGKPVLYWAVYASSVKQGDSTETTNLACDVPWGGGKGAQEDEGC